MNKCNWHNPDENGNYQAAKFTNPKETQSITMFFNGAQITLAFEDEGNVIAHMQHPICFCPMCGERVRPE